MKAIVFGIGALLLAAVYGVSQPAASDRDRLIGAWHLISITGPDGKPVTTGMPLGMLIYTRDGHMSVQLMYPKSESGLSNEYVQNGYEASFGSYNIDAAAHTVTHHVQGANTGDRLVGKDLPRVFQITPAGRLVIRSSHPEERWSVTWEHY